MTPSLTRTIADRLAQLVAEAADLVPAEACALLPSAATLQGTLLARALAGPASPADAESLLTIAEAAGRLGVSRDWLYRRAGRLPFTVRLGRQLRFSSRGLAEYLAAPAGPRGRSTALRPA